MTTQQLLVPSNATLKRNVMDYSLIVVGSFLQALSYVLFLAPYKSYREVCTVSLS